MKLGFVGVGRMGGPMARRLIKAGHTVVAFDASQAARDAAAAVGAEVVDSPRAVGDAAETVFVSLPTPPIVEAVVLGEGGIIEGGAVRTVIDLSTSGPAMAKAVQAKLAARDLVWLDAPVSGGVKGAQSGRLAIMVSGPRDAYDRLGDVLGVFGKVFFTGEAPGAAQVVKLGNNMMAAAAMVVSAEALAMGVKAGVDPAVMLEIINVSSGRNSATQDKFPGHVLTGTFDYGFATGLSYKDVRLCVDEAEALGAPMLAGALVREILAITNTKYGPDSDFTNIARVIEDFAGCEIRSRG